MDKQEYFLKLTTIIFILVILLNLLTVFTPEIGFDALWYHLTLPKLWLFKRQWYFPGGLLYYSAMPRLAETIYIPLVQLTGYVGPKMVQFLCGLGAAGLTYLIAKKAKLSKTFSLFSMFAFYITWLVSWQSGSAYIDLIRTFFEVFALYQLIQGKWLKGSLLLGLAIGTKWLALGSLAIYALIFGFHIIFPALLIALPWFVLAYRFTGNPIYPVFEPFLSHTFSGIQTVLQRLLLSPLIVTRPPDDFLTPLAGVFLIFSALVFFKSSDKLIRKLSLISILGTAYTMILNPPSSRFLLPFLPAMVISAMYFISKQSKLFILVFNYLLLGSFLLILFLRLTAVQKYIPFILGKQTQEAFLYSLRQRLPLTFVDTDGYVRNNLKDSSILIDKLHNLYYFPYNFDHASWADKATNYDYLVTWNENPANVDGKLIHVNNLGIEIFKLNHD